MHASCSQSHLLVQKYGTQDEGFKFGGPFTKNVYYSIVSWPYVKW